MEKKPGKRKEKTRKIIFAAFRELVEKKRYSSITVSDIISSADIGRSTFYAHFETKDDLLNALCEELFHHVFEGIPAAESLHDFSGTSRSLRQRLTHLLCHLREERGEFSRLFTGESGELFLQIFKNKLKLLFGSCSFNLPDSVPQEYAPAILAGGFAELILQWIHRGMEQSPETVSDCFFVMIPLCERSIP